MKHAFKLGLCFILKNDHFEESFSCSLMQYSLFRGHDQQDLLYAGTCSLSEFESEIASFVSATLHLSVITRPFVQLIRLINLHQAFPTCLFNGMEYAYIYIIDYLYSVYLWMIIFVVGLFLLTVPLGYISRLFMSSSVQVLMTLVHSLF